MSSHFFMDLAPDVFSRIIEYIRKNSQWFAMILITLFFLVLTVLWMMNYQSHQPLGGASWKLVH